MSEIAVNLTREAVLAMPAGNALDRLIAERVMGWHVDRVTEPGTGGTFDNYVDAKGRGMFRVWNWNPSGNTATAFEVLAKVACRKGWRYSLYSHDGTGGEEGSCWCSIYYGKTEYCAAGGIDAGEDWEAEPHEAVAICRAALLTTL